MPKIVKIYYFDYCLSNLGIWSRIYETSQRAAQRTRAKLIRDFGLSRPKAEITGEYGDCGLIYAEEVDVSPVGIVRLLNSIDPNGE